MEKVAIHLSWWARSKCQHIFNQIGLLFTQTVWSNGQLTVPVVQIWMM